MKFTISQLIPAALITLMVAVIPARATDLPISYTLTGTGTVVDSTDTTLTLQANAVGSFLPGDSALNAAWNPISYTDLSVLDFNTNLLNGNFTLSLADGDTLVGHVFEDQTAIDTSPSQTGPFPQTLTITGGTGAFAGATGSLSGDGFLGTTDFTVSGSGSVNVAAAPEPASAMLLFGGLMIVIGGASRCAGKRACCNRLT